MNDSQCKGKEKALLGRRAWVSLGTRAGLLYSQANTKTILPGWVDRSIRRARGDFRFKLIAGILGGFISRPTGIVKDFACGVSDK